MEPSCKLPVLCISSTAILGSLESRLGYSSLVHVNQALVILPDFSATIFEFCARAVRGQFPYNLVTCAEWSQHQGDRVEGVNRILVANVRNKVRIIWVQLQFASRVAKLGPWAGCWQWWSVTCRPWDQEYLFCNPAVPCSGPGPGPGMANNNNNECCYTHSC